MKLIDGNEALEQLAELRDSRSDSMGEYDLGVCVGVVLAMEVVRNLETVMEVDDNEN